MTNSKFGPLNSDYMKRIRDVTYLATNAHARTCVFTFILRLPEYRDNDDSITSTPDLKAGLMERFTDGTSKWVAESSFHSPSETT